MRRSFVLLGAAGLAAMVLVVLALHGAGKEGLHAVIRATARTSALCAALAFARIRVRDFSALLPVSHALHYAFIIAAGQASDPVAVAVGAVLYGVMLWNAARPNTAAIYILWISFFVAIATNGGRAPIYLAMTAGLILAGVARWWGARTRTLQST